MAKRKQSRAPEGADKGGQIGQGIARGSTKLVNDRLAAERHLLSRRKSLAVSQAARMPTVSAAELQADREAATERGGYVDRSLAKMKSAESSFELFLSEFPLDAAKPCPPVDKLVGYASHVVQSYSAGGLSSAAGRRSAQRYRQAQCANTLVH